jgi:hypothetical protein
MHVSRNENEKDENIKPSTKNQLRQLLLPIKTDTANISSKHNVSDVK